MREKIRVDRNIQRTAKETPLRMHLDKLVHDKHEDAVERQRTLRAERLAAEGVAEEKKRLTAVAQKEAQEEKKLTATHVLEYRKMASNRKKQKAYYVWLQLQFPANLAMALLQKTWTVVARSQRQMLMLSMKNSGYFEKYNEIPHLWDAEPKRLHHFGFSKPINAIAKKPCKCSPQLVVVLEKTTPPLSGGGSDPLHALTGLLETIFPGHKHIFIKTQSPQSLIHSADFNIDKAFITAIIHASKWLGPTRFPEGLYGTWPPIAPPGSY